MAKPAPILFRVRMRGVRCGPVALAAAGAVIVVKPGVMNVLERCDLLRGLDKRCRGKLLER